MKNNLQEIANILYINSQNVQNIGLLNGRMGICVFFYHYYRYTKNAIYEQYANYLLDEILNTIDKGMFTYDFSEGLTGCAWSINYLMENNFVEGNPDEILKHVDIKLLTYIKSLNNFSQEDRDKAFMFKEPHLFYVGLYFSVRIKNKEIDQNLREIINEIFNLCDLILNSSCNYSLSFYNSMLYTLSVIDRENSYNKKSLFFNLEQTLLNKDFSPNDLFTLNKLLHKINYSESIFIYKLIENCYGNSFCLNENEYIWNDLIYFNEQNRQINKNDVFAFLEKGKINVSIENLTLKNGLAGIGLSIIKSSSSNNN